LRAVNKIIKMPYDKPVQFLATELSLDNPKFRRFLKTDGDRLCALRLMPIDPKLPKLRMRGLSVRGAFDWFLNLDINANKYRADFRSHTDDCEWSSIFVVNRHGISGEIIRDRPHHLTQGLHDQNKPLVFHYDFRTWRISPADDEALTEAKKLTKYVYVPEADKRVMLAKKVGATFHNNYLLGYFETIESRVTFGLHFEDYSQKLGELYKDFTVHIDETTANENTIHGRGASAGVARGVVKIINSANDDFPDGAVLVTKMTTPDLVALMKRAAAIITDQGGILSHAAIVARELGVPCVVGTGNATQILRDNQTVEINGTRGVITLI
jgi:phosphohistidine swiveling domain-containing protein